MKRVVAIACLLTVALPLSACEHKRPGPAVEQAVAVAVDAPKVTVESTGTGTKEVLGFQDIDQKQTVTVDYTSGFAQDVVKAAVAATFKSSSLEDTTTTLPLEVEVSKASAPAEGQAEASRNAFFTVGVPAYTGNQQIGTAEGFQFGWRAQDSGQISSIRLAAPQTASDAARALSESAITGLISLPVVFPTEPIGTGAKWSVDSRVTGDNTLLQTVTYTLKQMSGQELELDVKVDQRPALGALSLEGQATSATDAPTGTLDVISSESASEGSLKVDLSKPLPVGGEVKSTTRVVYGQDKEELRVVQTTNTGWKFSSPAAN